MAAPARTSDRFEGSSAPATAGAARIATRMARRAARTEPLYPECMRFETERLLLREMEEADAPAMNVWESDPVVVRYQSNDVCTVAQTLERVRATIAAAAETPRRLYELTVVRREDALIIGRV